MLNQNPLWRYIVVIGMLLLALVYALPNLYPEDPALNISATRGGSPLAWLRVAAVGVQPSIQSYSLQPTA